ncbi:MAG: carboxypeptidase regulatory-like domain-containing protein [Oscillospiraceae bacterium]|nr:carboxypeptidase regulatory-like domain-containing protein [Oscillospiraceae bacterium]
MEGDFYRKWQRPLASATIHYNSSLVDGKVVTVGPTDAIPGGKYCIHVVDENGSAVSGANVTYGSASGVTDANGDAFFTRLTAGNPTIKVEKSGYKTWSNANTNWTKSSGNVDTKINLEFAENSVNKEASISLKGNKISFAVPDNIPFFGGSTLDFDLPIQSKVQFVAADDKIQLGINMELKGEDSDEEVKKNFRDLVRRAKRAGGLELGKLSGKDEQIFNSLVKSQNKWKLFGKDSVKVDFIGYGEANWGSSTATVDLLLRVKIKAADLSYTTWVVVVPVTARLEVNLEAGFEATASYDFSTSTLSGELDFNFNVGIKAFVGEPKLTKSNTTLPAPFAAPGALYWITICAQCVSLYFLMPRASRSIARSSFCCSRT